MKKNLFLVVFIIFTSVLLYKFGPHRKFVTKTQEEGVVPEVVPTITATPIAKKEDGEKIESKDQVKDQNQNTDQNPPPLLGELKLEDTTELKGSIKDFSELKNKVIASIPSKESLKEASPHGPSPLLVKAGKDLGEFKSFILKYPDNEVIQKRSEQFYEQCASQENYPNSIRSLCLYNRTVLSKNKGEKFDTSQYPDQVKNILLKPSM